RVPGPNLLGEMFLLRIRHCSRVARPCAPQHAFPQLQECDRRLQNMQSEGARRVQVLSLARPTLATSPGPAQLKDHRCLAPASLRTGFSDLRQFEPSAPQLPTARRVQPIADSARSLECDR